MEQCREVSRGVEQRGLVWRIVEKCEMVWCVCQGVWKSVELFGEDLIIIEKYGGMLRSVKKCLNVRNVKKCERVVAWYTELP